MDAARGVKGQGWPLYAGRRSSDGAREPRRSRGRIEGQDFLSSFGGAGHPGDCQKKLAQQGETRSVSKLGNRLDTNAQD